MSGSISVGHRKYSVLHDTKATFSTEPDLNTLLYTDLYRFVKRCFHYRFDLLFWLHKRQTNHSEQSNCSRKISITLENSPLTLQRIVVICSSDSCFWTAKSCANMARAETYVLPYTQSGFRRITLILGAAMQNAICRARHFFASAVDMWRHKSLITLTIR